MNDIKIFENKDFGKVRTLVIDNEPYFVGKDIAENLGYSNTRKAIIDHVDSEDKNTVTIRDGIQGNPNLVVINESGLYSLILSSKLPQAKKFKRWVTSEVLPSIRKHGAYMTDETLKKAIFEPDFLIQLATRLKEEKAQKELLEAQIEKDKPKVLFADTVSASATSILVGELAKLITQEARRRGEDIKIGQNGLFKWLRERGYLCKSGERRNQPLQTYIEMGIFEIKKSQYLNGEGVSVTTSTTKVTGKGQIYFVNKFLA